jgi:hypothetical protein
MRRKRAVVDCPTSDVRKWEKERKVQWYNRPCECEVVMLARTLCADDHHVPTPADSHCIDIYTAQRARSDPTALASRCESRSAQRSPTFLARNAP